MSTHRKPGVGGLWSRNHDFFLDSRIHSLRKFHGYVNELSIAFCAYPHARAAPRWREGRVTGRGDKFSRSGYFLDEPLKNGDCRDYAYKYTYVIQTPTPRDLRLLRACGNYGEM